MIPEDDPVPGHDDPVAPGPFPQATDRGGSGGSVGTSWVTLSDAAASLMHVPRVQGPVTESCWSAYAHTHRDTVIVEDPEQFFTRIICLP